MIPRYTRIALGFALFALSLQSFAQITIKPVEVGSLVQTRPTSSTTVLTHSATQNIVNFYTFNTVAGESVRVNFTNGGKAYYKVLDPVSFLGSLAPNGTVAITLSGLGGLLFSNSAQFRGIAASSVNTSGVGLTPSGVQVSSIGSQAQTGVISASNNIVAVQAPGILLAAAGPATAAFSGIVPVSSISLKLEKRELGF